MSAAPAPIAEVPKLDDRAAARPAVPAGPYLVVGLGRAGQAAARRLAAHSRAPVAAWDSSETPETRAAADEMGRVGVSVVLGGRDPQLLEGVRTLVKSPGVSPREPIVRTAHERGLAVIDELELGWRLQCAPVIGVTGSNGKGTVSMLIANLLRAAGAPAITAGNSEFAAPLSAATVEDGGWIVCEASSYQLEGAPSLLPEAAVFTNLTHDHLDRHRSMAAYAACKRRLFVRGRRAVPVAVVGDEHPLGRQLAKAVEARGGRALRYGSRRDSDYRVLTCDWDVDFGAAELDTPSGPLRLRSRLPGPHNAANLAGALAIGDLLGVERARSLDVLSSTPGLPGRFEAIDAGQRFRAVVDYAHNPGGYRAVLATARRIARARGGRLLVQISVTSQRDPSKRPAMGAIAAGFADRVIVTRGARGGAERPERALRDLLRGVPPTDSLRIVPDRRHAMRVLVREAQARDLLLVLGRGPTTRPLEPGAEPFDDRRVLREEIEASL
jgi:UDP-N-acetylmuramoyl-L-alanyl-D-glutamate--2,6-diaminopimelate ligase